MQSKTNLLMAMFILAIPLSLSAQDFMLQGWYWDYPKPANPNGNPSTESTFAKTLNTRVADLASAGFTYVWLPPLSRASFGHNSNGYAKTSPRPYRDRNPFPLGRFAVHLCLASETLQREKHLNCLGGGILLEIAEERPVPNA